jgi:hypothetical protein
VSIDNSGSPFPISGTTVRLLTSPADLQKAQAQQEAADGARAKRRATSPGRRPHDAGREAATTAEIEDIFGIAKQPVRLPAQQQINFRMGFTSNGYASDSALVPATVY